MIDWKIALEQADGDEELLQQVVEAVIVELPERMQALDVAVEQQRLKDAELHAHTIKTNALTLGAAALHQVAKQLETAAAAGDWETLKAQVGELRSLISAVIAELKQEK